MDHSTETIIVCGMLWTGSGALGDFLFDHEGVGRVSAHSFTAETAFTKGNYSLGHLNDTIRKGCPISDSDLAHLRHFLMGETAGFSSQFLEKAGFNLNLRRNAVPARRLGTPFREAVDNLISGIEPVTACDDPELRQRIFRKASRSFFCAFSNLIPDNQFLSYRKYLILNNDPNGTNISFINCIEPSVAFLVVRNPLDTFANTVLRGYYTATERDARSYAVMMRNRIDAFIESYRQDNLRSRLKALVFERFVMNPRSYGEKIMEYVSLGERHGNRFDPSISSKKIGIGQSLPPEVQVPIKKRALPAWDRLISFLTENRIMLNA